MREPTTAGTTPPGWPFFAPSTETQVNRALDLAELHPGEELVDLGCGDGQVLVAAARRGARVTGIEIDPELAAAATRTLAEAGFGDRGRVVVADLFEPGVVSRADVLFSYLSPATLQRLTPWLRTLEGARLVTVDFAVPELVADAVDGPAHLYRLPGRLPRPRPGRIGWSTAGSLCIQPPEVSSLVWLEAIHHGGAVEVRVDGALAGVASVAHGCDAIARGRAVAVDIRWRPQPPGTLVHGWIEIEGLGSHPVTVVYSEDEQGHWDLNTDGCTIVARYAGSLAEGKPADPRGLLAELGVDLSS